MRDLERPRSVEQTPRQVSTVTQQPVISQHIGTYCLLPMMYHTPNVAGTSHNAAKLKWTAWQQSTDSLLERDDSLTFSHHDTRQQDTCF